MVNSVKKIKINCYLFRRY